MANKNPSLEERLGGVAKAGKNYLLMDHLFEEYKKDPTNPKIFDSFIRYGGEPLPEDEVKLLRADVYRTRSLMEKCLEEEQKGLINQTFNNVSSILSEFSASDLYQFAASLPDKDKKYIKVAQALQKDEKGSVEQARKAYAQTFNNKVWKKFFEEEATEEEVTAYASRYVKLKERQFMNKFISEREVDGKKKPEIDKNKLFAYVGKQLFSYKPEEKQNVYLQLGQVYTQMQLKKEQEAKEAAEMKKAA